VALAENFAEHGHTVSVIAPYANPNLYDIAKQSGGELYEVKGLKNVWGVANCLEKIQPKIDMALTNLDDALASGERDEIESRVDLMRRNGLLLPMPNREGAKIEWDKFFLRELVEEIEGGRREFGETSWNPYHIRIEKNQKPKDRHEAVKAAIQFFREKGIEFVVKPRNLTGGKGVQVMGKHFDSYEAGEKYAFAVLDADDQEGVEIQEKLTGHEFTLQIFTDGETIIEPPETFDYPYRRDGDEGPGTGGMGAFSMAPGEHLPFVTQEDYDAAIGLTREILRRLKERGIDYKGIIYPSFFKTDKGLKIVEINARGGDPELINIVDLVQPDIDLAEVYRQIAAGELLPDSVRFQNAASAMVYLVHPDYGKKKMVVRRGRRKHVIEPDAVQFDFDMAAARAKDVRVRFAAAQRLRRDGRDRFHTVSASRILGLSALSGEGGKPWEAREKILAAIAAGFGGRRPPLDYREEVAAEAYIRAMYTRAA
jgi:phosphoribosylamine--glycine ligase